MVRGRFTAWPSHSLKVGNFGRSVTVLQAAAYDLYLALIAFLFAGDAAIILLPRFASFQRLAPHIRFRWLLPLIFSSASSAAVMRSKVSAAGTAQAWNLPSSFTLAGAG